MLLGDVLGVCECDYLLLGDVDIRVHSNSTFDQKVYWLRESVGEIPGEFGNSPARIFLMSIWEGSSPNEFAKSIVL